MRSRWVTCALAVAVAAALLGAPASGATERQGPRVARAIAAPVGSEDFNHDGFADLAVGVPKEDVGTVADAGSVNVLYGGSAGLSATGNQQFYEGNGGVPGPAAANDDYGAAVATGDFDRDGFADLAIGIPGRAVTGRGGAGSVEILYGSASGLSTARSQLWSQGQGGLADVAEPGDAFGSSLAAGDLDGDGFADLAIGAPAEEVDGMAKAGAVSVLYGSSSGLAAAGDQFWNQDVVGIQDVAEGGDQFGLSLGVGDMDGDGDADLAIGVPFEDLGPSPDAGAVEVLRGSPSGLTTTRNQFWNQDSTGVDGAVQAGANFGVAMATGDMNGDGKADLAVGSPGTKSGSASAAGEVNVMFGSAVGLSAVGNQAWTQNSPGVPGTAEAGDRFGGTLAVADFAGDGDGDLAVGAPGEDIGSVVDAGVVDVLPGTPSGLGTTGTQEWQQGVGGVSGSSGKGDMFGAAFATGDFGNGAHPDLAIGVPKEDLPSEVDAGDVQVLYAGAAGLASSGNQEWDQGSPSIAGGPEQGDAFGSSLA